MIPQPSITEVALNIMNLEYHSNLSGTNELNGFSSWVSWLFFIYMMCQYQTLITHLAAHMRILDSSLDFSLDDWNPDVSVSHDAYVIPFYPRPVLAFGYCRCLRVCVCVCVCLSVNHQLVRAVTHQPFKLESPNLDQRCKRPWLRSLLFF